MADAGTSVGSDGVRPGRLESRRGRKAEKAAERERTAIAQAIATERKARGNRV